MKTYRSTPAQTRGHPELWSEYKTGHHSRPLGQAGETLRVQLQLRSVTPAATNGRAKYVNRYEYQDVAGNLVLFYSSAILPGNKSEWLCFKMGVHTTSEDILANNTVTFAGSMKALAGPTKDPRPADAPPLVNKFYAEAHRPKFEPSWNPGFPERVAADVAKSAPELAKDLRQHNGRLYLCKEGGFAEMSEALIEKMVTLGFRPGRRNSLFSQDGTRLPNGIMVHDCLSSRPAKTLANSCRKLEAFFIQRARERDEMKQRASLPGRGLVEESGQMTLLWDEPEPVRDSLAPLTAAASRNLGTQAQPGPRLTR